MDYNEVFYYDETSPSCLRWKVDFRATKYGRVHEIGDSVGSLTGLGRYKYYKVQIKGLRGLAHRIIWTMLVGEIPEKYVVDHIDGDTTNNRVSNLSCKTQKQNMQNKAMCENNSTGITGVCWEVKKRYMYARAYVRDNGKNIVQQFSENKLGVEVAFIEACLWREEQIARLNEKGENFLFRPKIKTELICI